MKLNKKKSKSHKPNTLYAVTTHKLGSSDCAVCGVAYTKEKAEAISNLFNSNGVYSNIYEVREDWYDDLLAGICKIFYCSMSKDESSLEISESSVSHNFGETYEQIERGYSDNFHMYTFAKDFGEAEKNFRQALKEYIDAERKSEG